MYLCEIDYLDPVTMAVSTLRFSSGDGGYVTYPDDDPANTFYEPRLKTPNNYEVHVFRDGITGGCAEGGFGTAQFMNHDGYFDQFATKCFDGQKFRLLYGQQGAHYADFIVVLTATMAQPEFIWNYFNLKVRDYTQLFARAASQRVYLGNNTASYSSTVVQGIEGTIDDLMGQTKPLCFGRCLNVKPAYVSQQNEIFQVHDGPIHAITAVYSNGVALELDTTQGTSGYCATLAALQAASPAEGKYCTCLARGLLRITGVADTNITCSVQGCSDGPDGYTETVSGLVKLLAANYARRKRTNICSYSETPSHASWVKTGFTVGVAAPTAPIAGMTTAKLTGATGSSYAKTLAVGTGVYMAGWFVLADTTTQVQIKGYNPSATGNNILAKFDLSTGLVTDLQTNGNAVGPQYTADGFITDAGVIAYEDNWLFVWAAGQPDEEFSSATFELSSLNGTSLYVGGAQIEAYNTPSIYTGPTLADPVSAYDPAIAPELDTDSFAALSGLTAPVGYYVPPGGGDTVGSIIQALCDSLGCYTAINRDGKLAIGRLTQPASDATPVATYTEQEILQDSIDSSAPFDSTDGAPAYRVTLEAVKNWTTLSKSDVATSLWTSAPMWVMWLGKETRKIVAEDATVLARHPLASEITKTTLLVTQADALAEGRRLLAYYSSRLQRYSFSIKQELANFVNIGDVICLNISRFGLDSGQNFVVIGITETLESGRISLEVLG